MSVALTPHGDFVRSTANGVRTSGGVGVAGIEIEGLTKRLGVETIADWLERVKEFRVGREEIDCPALLVEANDATGDRW